MTIEQQNNNESLIEANQDFWGDYFSNFEKAFIDIVDEDKMKNPDFLNNLLKLKDRLIKIQDSFLYFTDLYQNYGGNGDNITLSDYSTTNYSVFDRLFLSYKQNILTLIKEYNLDHDFEKLNASIEVLHSETLFIKRYLKEVGDLYKVNDLNDMPGAAFEIFESEDLLNQGDLVQEMVAVYSKNYENYPQLVEKVISNLKKSISEKNSKFVVLKYQDRLVGFYRITEVDENKIYFSSFNLSNNYKGLGFGESMMSQYLDLLAKDKLILAECDPFVPISSHYIERGFVGTSLGQIGEKGILKITRDENKTFETKQTSKEEFVKEYLEFEIGGGNGVCDRGDYLIQKASTQAEVDMSYLDKGNVLTRYFSQTNNGKKEWYAVFEKRREANEEREAA